MNYKIIIAAAMLGSSCYADAQTNAQVYGLIDTAIEHVTNVDAAGSSITRMPNLTGGMAPSRIGFRGEEDLHGGLKVFFTIENGFSPDSGSTGQGNRLFGRQAFVGLSGRWGTLTVGRNYTMLFHSFFDVDLMGPSQFSIGAMDPYLPNARSDNSVAYKGTFSHLTLGATYSLGRDVSSAGGPAATNCAGELASDQKACRQWSALVRYDLPQWGVVGAFERYNGGTGALATFGPTSSSLSDTRIHIGAYARLGFVKVGAGWLRRDNEGNASNPGTDLPYFNISYQATPAVTIDAQIGRLDVRDSDNHSDMLALRASYAFSKRTAVYAMCGHMANAGTAAVSLNVGGTAAQGASQNGVLAGVRHAF
jgi:predicted porin